MTRRAVYFKTLKRALNALASHSDAEVTRSSKRLMNTALLIDYKTRAREMPVLDVGGTCLPTLPDVLRVNNDIRDDDFPPVRDRASILAKMLDAMLIGKRLPSDREIDDIAYNLYREKLAEFWVGSSEEPRIFGATSDDSFQIVESEYLSDHMTAHMAWDYWPAEQARPYGMYMNAVIAGDDLGRLLRDAITEIAKLGHRHNIPSANLLDIAADIDKRKSYLRVKELKRVTFTGFQTPFFKTGDQMLSDTFLNADYPDESWVMTFNVTTLKSRGTVTKKGEGFLAGNRIAEEYYVDQSRQETKSRGCSEFDQHALTTGRGFKSLASIPEFMKSHTVHVLSNDGTLHENV